MPRRVAEAVIPLNLSSENINRRRQKKLRFKRNDGSSKENDSGLCRVRNVQFVFGQTKMGVAR